MSGDHLYFYVPNTGLIRVVSNGNGILKHAVIDSKLSRSYAGYRLISKDISLIKEALDELLKSTLDKVHVINQSLSFFIIITHAKGFTSADGRKIKLDKHALKYCSDTEKRLHEELIEIRNQYIAHAGRSKFERNQVVMVQVPFENEEPGFKVYDNPIFMTSLKVNVELYQLLIDNIKRYVDEKVDEAYSRLCQNISDELDWEIFDKYCFVPDHNKLIPLEMII